MSSGACSSWTSRAVVCGACALLVYSFLVLDDAGSTHSLNSTSTVREDSPKLVFIVIDAFRLSFLTSPDSPMSFTKGSIAQGSAHLFDAFARMPTVTLPRITAYITGTLPSFGTILTNLATDEIKIDNWISPLSAAGKRIHFFGDDTWIRLLPEKFEKSEGVTSFFVNDYTEVDDNVTRNLHVEFQNFPDVLILHYLGLDHIGHSLGGVSPRIPEKLVEMDGILKRIHDFLMDSGERSYLIACGDHGMTPGGSHGGASSEETRVPVVIWEIGNPLKSFKKPQEKPQKIEQIDISSTIFDLFSMDFPAGSYGISLADRFQNEAEILEKQHRHFRNIVREKSLEISDICEENCDYSDKFVAKALRKWFRQVQEELIGTASEIPTSSIVSCFFMLIAATVISIRSWISGASRLNFSIFLLNFISFASSLIEEEHEIWFFLGSTVIVIRAVQSIRIKNRKQLKSIILLGILHRLAYGYMQSTRRRWSIDQSLLPSSPFSDALDLNVNDPNTGLQNFPIVTITVSFLGWIVVLGRNGFWMVFPLISHFLRHFGKNYANSHLLVLIRLLVIPFGYSTGSILIGVLLLILSISPPSQLLLLLAIFQIGRISEKLNLSHSENLIICMATFFYTGNSNSLSTLSLTPAYVGLLDYYPIIVGAQLLLYTFSGPIVFLCARKASQQWLHLLFSYRISALATSLLGLLIFQNHLFIWSVYSPKVVYDMAHVIFLSVIGLL
uniref:GPI ethanolamine phosphate transferase 2 n=1 Tax=Caenorhabditis tropicalis TaxID=1561998 RepID=A0A1I7TA58_9PELO